MPALYAKLLITGLLTLLICKECAETAYAQSSDNSIVEESSSPPAVSSGVPAPVAPTSTLDDSDECKSQRWYCGVPEAARRRAENLFSEGTLLMTKDGDFLGAIESFNSGLQHWDNPSIHYNLMLAYKSLKQFRKAYHHANEAIRYGESGLPPGRYHKTLEYIEDFLSRFARITISCDVPGTHIELDAEKVLLRPESRMLLVDPKRYILTAQSEGYLPLQSHLDLFPNDQMTTTCAMAKPEDQYVQHRRWPRIQKWLWRSVGVGVGLAIAGGTLQWRADTNNRQFQILFSVECPAGGGCFRPDFSSRLELLESRSKRYRKLGYGAYALGGLLAVTSAVFFYINRNVEIENPQFDKIHQWKKSKRTKITATASPGYAGITATKTF